MSDVSTLKKSLVYAGLIKQSDDRDPMKDKQAAWDYVEAFRTMMRWARHATVQPKYRKQNSMH